MRSFGLGRQLSSTIRTPLLVVAATILLLGVLYTLRERGNPLLFRIGLYLILAAGLSNLLDRILRGRVIDFLNVGVGTLRTGIFNVADVALMLGLALVLLARRTPIATMPIGPPPR